MNRHPGFFVIAFACLGLMSLALWPSSAPARKNSSAINVYIGSEEQHSEQPSSSDSETSLEQPYNEEETGDALPDENAITAI